MKKFYGSVACFFLAFSLSYAQNPPLRIAVNRFVPPYVLQGANNQLSGFDISMMSFICHHIQRDCVYQTVNFNELLSTVTQKKADLGLGAIAITPDWLTEINFSSPYLPSQLRFLGHTDQKERFSLSLLANKRIGIEEGTVFSDILQQMNITNPKIITFKFETDMIDALTNKRIDFVLVNSPTARYWANQSSGMLKTLGMPMPYGFGLGIILPREETRLLATINEALALYQKSSAFIKDYHMYLEEF